MDKPKRRRACVCFVTGEKGFNDIFIRKKVGSTWRYFKNEAIYTQYLLETEKVKKDKQDKEKFRLTVSNILGLKFPPPILIKELNELLKYFNADVIVETFKLKQETINYWWNLDGKFKDDYSRVKYTMAIIKSDINMVDRQWQTEQRRKQLSQKIEVDIDVVDDIFDIPNKVSQKEDSISKFL